MSRLVFTLRNGKILIALPGVPHEMEGIFMGKVVPFLEGEFSLRNHHALTVKMIGLSEAEVIQKLGQFLLDFLTVKTNEFKSRYSRAAVSRFANVPARLLFKF